MRRKIWKKRYKALCRLILGGMTFMSSMFINQHTLKALPIEPATPDKSSNINITTSGKTMNISGSAGNAYIKWRDFSVGPNEKVNFFGMTNMLNYVAAVNPSLIYGTINAIGVNNFYIINPNGILFGPNSRINTNNLFVSTRSLTDAQIQSYVNGGDNYDIFAANTPLINNGGLKSSDILGTYDIADGDVMFLGQVQANSLKVEGNTIQIRNTDNIRALTSNGNPATTTDGETDSGNTVYTWDNAAKLSGSNVTLISDNPPEVGYVVTSSSVNMELVNPFDFDDATYNDKDKMILALADHYGIYLYTNGTGSSRTIKHEESDTEFANNLEVSEANYETLGKLYDFFRAQIVTNSVDLDGNGTAGEENDKIINALALDTVIKDSITKSSKQVRIYGSEIGVVEQFVWSDANIFTFDDATKFNTNANSDYSKKLYEVQQQYNTVAKTPTYKYFLADAVGDDKMLNSANNLNWTAKTLNGNTQTIDDYRLLQNPFDFNLANHSKWTSDNQLTPTEGTIHGNYMLDRDIDFTASPYNITSFKPLGYNMDYSDFASESDKINFNGLNFKISNLTTDNTVSENQGLFSIFSGTIKNLRFQNVKVGDSTTKNAGALVGLIAQKGGLFRGDYNMWVTESGGTTYDIPTTPLESTIKNVSVLENSNNSITGSYAGGLVGTSGGGEGSFVELTMWGEDRIVVHSWEEVYAYQAQGYSYYDYPTYNIPGAPQVTFENIENFAPITSIGNAGGIVGQKVNGAVDIKNSINNGNVSASSGEGVGGMIGNILSGEGNYDDYDYIYNIEVNKVNLEKVFNTGTITGKDYVGGLIGKSTNKTTISKSWNEGAVTSTGSTDSSGAGGIVGQLSRVNMEQVFNLGDVTGGYYTGGLVGTIPYSNATFKNVYNKGNITGSDSSGYAGGLFGYFYADELENAYNAGNISGYYSGGLIGRSLGYRTYMRANVTNAYNVGNVTGTNSAGLISVGDYNFQCTTLTNVYNGGLVSSSNDYTKLFHGDTSGLYFEQTNVQGGEKIDVSQIYSNWGNIDTTGGNSSAVWRVYANPSNPTDKNRQPLLTEFMLNADVQRYSVLDSAGSVDPYYLVTPTLNMHAIHDSAGNVLDVRYKNNGKSSVFDKGSESYYHLLNPDFVKYDILETATTDQFAVNDTTNFSKALLYSEQFGYNFSFDKSTDSNWQNDTTNSKISEAGTAADANAIYLKMGTPSNISDPPETEKKIEDPPGTHTSTETQEVTVDISITASSGQYNKVDESVTYDDGSTGSHYTVSNPSGASLDGFTFTYNDQAAEVKNADNTTNYYTSMVAITYNGVTYSLGNGLTANSNGTYSFTKKIGTTTYNFTINPGKITSTNTLNVVIDVGNLTNTNGSYSEGTYSANNATINTLISGIFDVVDNGNGTTTLKFKDSSITGTTSGDTTTYTVDGKTFTKNNTTGVFTYIDNTNSNNPVTYNVTLNPGTITNLLNKTVTIQANDGTITNEVLTVTENSDGKTYTISAKNYSGNDDAAAATTISGLLGTLTVTQTADGEHTTIVLREGGSLTSNGDGTYNYTSTVGNTTTTYLITIINGNITTISEPVVNNIEVEINVDSRTKTDGVLDTITGDGYSVDNEVIAGLISGKVVVVEKDGKMTLALADGTTLNEGSNTYSGYTFTKNSDGTYTYSVTSGNNTTNYIIKLNPGDITSIISPSPTTETINVEINVESRTKTDGVLNSITGEGYTVNNEVIAGLISGKVVVVEKDGKMTLALADGTTLNEGSNTYSGYTFTKNSDGTYTYSVTSGNNTTNYIIKLNPGDITKYTTKNVEVEINVNPRTETNGVLDDITGDGYTVDNEVIKDLISGKVKVVEKNGKVTLVFTDGSTVKTGTNTIDGYTFTKNANGTYTYTVINGNNTTNYIIKLNPGNITKYTTKDVNVTINVDSRTETNGVLDDITGDGYTVDNEVIKDLISGKVKVVEKNGKVTLVFTDGSTVKTGTNTIDGYTFTKNANGTYTYTVINGNNTTNYIIKLNPGDITKYTTQDIDVEINVDSRTKTNGVLNTITGDGYSVDNEVIKDLISGKVVAVEKNGKMTLALSDGTTLDEGTNTYGGYTFTKNADGTYAYTVTNGNDTINYNITLIPGKITTITPERTPIPDSTPTNNNVTPTPTPNSTPTNNVTPTNDVTPTNNEVTQTPTPTPNPTPTNDPTPTNNDVTPAPTPDSTITLEITEEVDDPDVNLRSSNIETFPEEKGDYVDLDLQDHTLIEVTNVNEAIDNLNIVPEEFDEAAARNVVNNNRISLTSINEADEALANENLDGDVGLTGINSTDNNLAAPPESTNENSDSNNTSNNEMTNLETDENNPQQEQSNSDNQNSQESTSENEQEENLTDSEE